MQNAAGQRGYGSIRGNFENTVTTYTCDAEISRIVKSYADRTVEIRGEILARIERVAVHCARGIRGYENVATINNDTVGIAYWRYEHVDRAVRTNSEDLSVLGCILVNRSDVKI